jgi:AcrR family transcriptional regulator
MMPTPRLTRAQSKARTRRRLLDAAGALFRQRGYHGTSLEAIASDAGFTIGAVYSTFSSKADLFLALIDERIDRQEREKREIARRDGTLEERADEIARLRMKELESDPGWFPVMVEFWAHAARDEGLRRKFAVRHERLVAAFAESARDALPESASELGLSPAEFARIAIIIGNGIALERLSDSELSDGLLGRLGLALVPDPAPSRRRISPTVADP